MRKNQCHHAVLRPNAVALAKLDTSLVEVDALKHLQAGSRRGLHPALDALLPVTLDKAFKGEIPCWRP